MEDSTLFRSQPMKLESLPVTKLKPAPYNPRLTLKPGDQSWEKLERSLDEFELVQPIVWNRTTEHVVSGHQRLAVLKHRGAKHADCVVVELSLEKEKALNITLNNSEVGSDWDATKLVDIVGELQSLPDFDATLTGFDEQQLRDLVLAPEVDEFEGGNEQIDESLHRVALEVPKEVWNEVSELLNEMLSVYPTVRLHHQ